MCESERRTSGRVAARPDSSYGKASRYCRTGAAGRTQSTRCAAVPAMRRPAQLGHSPRSLHENATATSFRHAGHLTWTNPREKSPHSRYSRKSSRTYGGSGPSYASCACWRKASRCCCTRPKSTPSCPRRGTYGGRRRDTPARHAFRVPPRSLLATTAFGTTVAGRAGSLGGLGQPAPDR